MTFHRKDLNRVSLTNTGYERLKPFFNAWNVKDLASIPRAKDKMVVNQGNRSCSATILITHVYIIS